MKMKITATATVQWSWLLRDLRPAQNPIKQFGPFDTEEEAVEWEKKMRVDAYKEVVHGKPFTKDYAPGSGLEWFQAPTQETAGQGYGLVKQITKIEEVEEIKGTETERPPRAVRRAAVRKPAVKKVKRK